MESQLQKCYNLVIELTRRAGKLARCHFKKPKNVQTKLGAIDFVTETDHQVERLLVTSLLRNFPDHKYIGEESVAEGQKCHLTDDPTWIIDPVDGTMNFVHNNPTFCISVALWITKKPHIGVIYNPVLDLMFTARRGKGAFLNGNRIAASSTTDVEKALIAYEIGSIQDLAYMQVTLANIETLAKKIHGFRVSGCATWNLASVAMGGIDCNFEFGSHIWDMAAGVLLAQEAGGFVCDPCGGELDPLSRRVLCTGTEELAQKIIPLIKQYYPKRDDN